MLTTRESVQKIFDFQKNKARELKRPITFSEAVALWFSQTMIEQTKNKKKMKKLTVESII